MENETPIHRCRNCSTPLPEDARFCPQCSQKNHDGRLTFGEMVSETIATLFNLDNRIFSTLRAMVLPGKLTTEYFEGKHVQYYHPLRLFLFTGLALISVLTVRYKQGDGYAQMEKVRAEMEREHLTKKTYEHLDSLRLEYTKGLSNPVAIQAVDSFSARVGILHDSSADRDSTSFGINLFDGRIKGVKVSSKDLMELSVDSLLAKYHVTGYWDRLFLSRTARMMKGGINEYLQYMFGNVIWMLLVLMPLMALVLKLLYIRKPFLYYEHFVFNLHVHATTFFIFFLTLMFKQQPPGWLITISILVSLFYPFIAMKRVYKQGFWKTSIKYFLLTFAYAILGIASFVILAVISFAMF
ncbi:MAG: DUF3667 domain-containing protein [Saprospiraceae bacterium]|nr:DUF3667 domain-containing protein [Saprospiraceae bacterium]